MVYQIEASASVNDILTHYSDLFYNDNGTDCALRLLDAFDEAIVAALTNNPDRGCHLEDIPNKYRAVPFWPHLWLVYMVYGQIVYVDMIIDDRKNYGKILKL
jgi:plasmid stabilization system protein ParE